MSDSLSLGSGRHLFCKKVLQRCVVEHGIRQQLLQVGTLALLRHA